MFARSIQIKCLVLNTRFRLLERDDKPVETIFSSKGFAYSYIIVLVDNVLIYGEETLHFNHFWKSAVEGQTKYRRKFIKNSFTEVPLEKKTFAHSISVGIFSARLINKSWVLLKLQRLPLKICTQRTLIYTRKPLKCTTKFTNTAKIYSANHFLSSWGCNNFFHKRLSKV